MFGKMSPGLNSALLLSVLVTVYHTLVASDAQSWVDTGLDPSGPEDRVLPRTHARSPATEALGALAPCPGCAGLRWSRRATLLSGHGWRKCPAPVSTAVCPLAPAFVGGNLIFSEQSMGHLFLYLSPTWITTDGVSGLPGILLVLALTSAHPWETL